MTNLLRVDSSARLAGSRSRELGDLFEASWLARFPHTRIVRRELATDPLPHIAAETIQGYYTPAEQMTDRLREATALSDKLIAELESADVLLLTLPMYNFSIPSVLKAWIDQVVRIHRTVGFDGQSFEGLVKGKWVYVISSRGAAGYENGGPLSAVDYQKPYLRHLLGFLGMTNVTFVEVEATNAGPDVATANIEKARRRIADLVAALPEGSATGVAA